MPTTGERDQQHLQNAEETPPPDTGQEGEQRAWYAMPAEDALEAQDSGRDGLTQEEAEQRFEHHGPNSIAGGKQITWWQVLLGQFTSPLIYVLLAALIVTLAIREWGDATVIGLVLLVNTVVGFFQEYKAENAIQALMAMVSPKATVRREGEEREIDSDRLVPGDLVLLREGMMVPADCRLVQVEELQVDEAALTGESVPVSKQAAALEQTEQEPQPGEQADMAFMNTAITSGSAEALVVATGERTRVGRIARSLREEEGGSTPLQERMDRLARFIALAILLIAGLTFAVGTLILGRSLVEMFMMAVALSVSAMPAGLPVVMTAALAISVQRMARRQAVIRHLPAVETLGSTTAIVSDKTGTLTRNRMTTRSVWSGGRQFQLAGPAMRGEGRVERDGEPVDLDEQDPCWRTLLAGLLCNEATWKPPVEDEEEATAEGDPIEVALLVAAATAGLDQDELRGRYERVDHVPFSSERRYAGSMHRDPEGGEEPLVFCKGAPETIIAMCDRAAGTEGDEDVDAEALGGEADRLAGEGLRLLGMCEARGQQAAEAVREGSLEGARFLGFQGLMDPPREEAAEAVDACHQAGIRVIMVTGDHARTAAAIAAMVHIDRAPRFGDRHDDETDAAQTRVVSGQELAAMDDEELDEVSRRVTVFARSRPDQKLRLVKRLKESQEIVAVTGDGVNDAPALKSAHLGVAMGQTGTDVAKQASEMVLTDDNFATIEAAIEEGRTAFRNIRMATFFLLSTGLAEVIAILSSFVLGWPLPFVPAQILWLNVVTNGIEDVALAFEPSDRDLLERPPRPPEEGILSRLLIERTIIVGLWLALGTLGIFAWEWYPEQDTAYARVAALTLLVLFQVVHVFNCRSEFGSIVSRSPLRNKILLFGAVISLGVHVGAMYMPWTQQLLDLQPLALGTWLIIALAALTVIPVNELHKAIRKPAWRRQESGAA